MNNDIAEGECLKTKLCKACFYQWTRLVNKILHKCRIKNVLQQTDEISGYFTPKNQNIFAIS